MWVILVLPDPSPHCTLDLSSLVLVWLTSSYVSVRPTCPSKAYAGPSMRWSFSILLQSLLFRFLTWFSEMTGSRESPRTCLQPSCASWTKRVKVWGIIVVIEQAAHNLPHPRISSLSHVTDWTPTFLSLAGKRNQGNQFDGVRTFCHLILILSHSFHSLQVVNIRRLEDLSCVVQLI